MAKGDKKHFGAKSQGKHSGSGANTDTPDVPENMVLSNRDKAQHASGRGQDTKWIQTEQLQNHEANHLDDEGKR